MRFIINGSAPSWKNHRRIITNQVTGKRSSIKSEVSERWYRGAVFELRSQLAKLGKADFPISDTLHIEISLFYKGKRRPDLDNAIQGPLDALQGAGVIANDSQVVEILATIESQTGYESYCEIEITQV